MNGKTVLILAVVSALGCGLIGGVFFAFSTFVMKGLFRLPADEGIAAMQAINVAAISPLFMAALFGTGLLCAALAVFALTTLSKPGSNYLLAGSLLYITCTILVTIVFNVPRNNALAKIEAGSIVAASFWAAYVISWTGWNHVRTVGALAAAALFVFGALKIGAAKV